MTTARLVSRVLRAEWTKLWTVRRRAAGLAAAALLSVLSGVLAANGTEDNTNQRADLITGRSSRRYTTSVVRVPACPAIRAISLTGKPPSDNSDI